MSLEKYNQIYSENEGAFNKPETEKIISNILNYKTSGSVLDLGSGPGGDVFFLAKKGFKVTALDQSNIVIDKINLKSAEENLDVQAETGDIKEFEFKEPYDIIICKRALHNLSQEEALELIKRMKEKTADDGLNIIIAFTEEGDFFNIDNQHGRFYPKREELRNLYSDWEILEYGEAEGQAFTKRPTGENMKNISARLIARKK